MYMQKWHVEYGCWSKEAGSYWYNSSVVFNDYGKASKYFNALPLGVNDAIFLEYSDNETACVLASLYREDSDIQRYIA